MFYITEQPIVTQFELDKLQDLSVGGIVVFEGRVRNHNEGKVVKALEYEIYPEMAVSEGEKILKVSLAKFDIKNAVCIHRYGELNLGEVAVLVIAASKHRKEAFMACEFIIDKVKEEVPVWKKEHYLDAPSEWIACHRCAGEH